MKIDNLHIIGVTGHRDIHPDTYKEVKELADFWLDEQIRQYGHPNIAVQSPLAAGADQLIASLAAEKGIRLIVPYPFSLKRYRQDFSPSEEEKFSSLLETAETSFEVTALAELENRYLAVGAHVAQTSHMLLALWDGRKQPQLEGGTAHIVRCQLEGFPESLLLQDHLQNRETTWIKTARSSSDPLISPEIRTLTEEDYRDLP